jgi:hypothetical protein
MQTIMFASNVGLSGGRVRVCWRLSLCSNGGVGVVLEAATYSAGVGSA